MNDSENKISMKDRCVLMHALTNAKHGYINGYRWGVEYPTNGKKPDLPEDTSVQVRNDIYAFWTCGQVGGLSWSNVFKFKITDHRYKPVNLDYLYDDKGFPIASDANTERVSEIPESKSNAENVSDWWDYETQKAVAKTPPMDYECEYSNSDFLGWKKCKYIGVNSLGSKKYVVIFDSERKEYENPKICEELKFRPLDWNRKAEAEKKRVVDAAFDEAIKAGCVDFRQWLSVIYDAGFLRMPAE